MPGPSSLVGQPPQRACALKASSLTPSFWRLAAQKKSTRPSPWSVSGPPPQPTGSRPAGRALRVLKSHLVS
eukprot:scaffold8069_cov126-Isochrysis_galbana.AAC.6